MTALLSALLLGFVLGIRHATDADHVVAVGAIASRARSASKAIAVGVSWGLGHALTVLLVGGAIVLFGVVVPPRLGLGMELTVALLLIVLGVWNLKGAFSHVHQTGLATPGDPVAPVERSARRAAAANDGAPPGTLLRSLGVGVVHGLAGSAAVALLVLASIREPVAALGYLAVFGLGTIVGMVLLTSVLAIPVALAAERFERFHRGFARAAGALSLAFGLVLAYQIGVVDGFFTGSPSWSPK